MVARLEKVVRCKKNNRKAQYSSCPIEPNCTCVCKTNLWTLYLFLIQKRGRDDGCRSVNASPAGMDAEISFDGNKLLLVWKWNEQGRIKQNNNFKKIWPLIPKCSSASFSLLFTEAGSASVSSGGSMPDLHPVYSRSPRTSISSSPTSGMTDREKVRQTKLHAKFCVWEIQLVVLWKRKEARNNHHDFFVLQCVRTFERIQRKSRSSQSGNGRRSETGLCVHVNLSAQKSKSSRSWNALQSIPSWKWKLQWLVFSHTAYPVQDLAQFFHRRNSKLFEGAGMCIRLWLRTDLQRTVRKRRISHCTCK